MVQFPTWVSSFPNMFAEEAIFLEMYILNIYFNKFYFDVAICRSSFIPLIYLSVILPVLC